MEVHPHGHVHSDKKWKEYLFQFVMLFLAVTLSFFVENQREHYIENQRAKVMAASMIDDLRADTGEVHRATKHLSAVIGELDTLMAELEKPEKVQDDSLIHVLGFEKISNFNMFDPQTGSYDQVKNSGSLRYFRQDQVKRMSEYENDKNYILKMAGLFLDYRSHYLVPFCLQNQNPHFIAARLKKQPYNGPVFIKPPTEETLDQLYTNALYEKREFKRHIFIMQRHETAAIALIGALCKEFDLQ
ncbi:MAG: hypothetical protein NT040_03895 [Bacteroidetes bacterium]|nr:hypothetical protein [Bacteroidota bacterium]